MSPGPRVSGQRKTSVKCWRVERVPHYPFPPCLLTVPGIVQYQIHFLCFDLLPFPHNNYTLGSALLLQNVQPALISYRLISRSDEKVSVDLCDHQSEFLSQPFCVLVQLK